MKNYLVLCLTFTLIACGPSQGEKEKIAAVSCAVMSETRNMDAAIRVEKINEARDKIGGEPFLRGDDVIQEAFEYGLCEELVLSDVIYDESKRIADSNPTVEELFYPNGELKERTNYQSKDDGGKKHGLFRRWYENGQLWSEHTYKDGRWDGLNRWWHENGQLEKETTYKDGEEDGLSRWWRENGQPRIEITYKNGEEDGLSREWRVNGSLWWEECYSNGEEVDMSNCQG